MDVRRAPKRMPAADWLWSALEAALLPAEPVCDSDGAAGTEDDGGGGGRGGRKGLGLAGGVSEDAPVWRDGGGMT